jgi:hypothetical protein
MRPGGIELTEQAERSAGAEEWSADCYRQRRCRRKHFCAALRASTAAPTDEPAGATAAPERPGRTDDG